MVSPSRPLLYATASPPFRDLRPHPLILSSLRFPLFLQILFNKAVLDQLKFPFPMFLTTWHMVLATILTQIMSKTTSMLPGVKEVSHPVFCVFPV